MAFGLPDGLPEYTLGWGAVEWMSRYLMQPNGKRAGLNFEPTLLQTRLILWHYAVDENGEFIYRRTAFRAAKGHGKVSISSSIALFELCGGHTEDVPEAGPRFSHWEHDENGKKYPVGKAMELPWVALAANTENQTAIVFSMLVAMIPAGCDLRVECGLDVQRTQIRSAQINAKLDCLSASAGAIEGFPYTAAFMDEQEHATPGNGGVAMDRVVKRNVSKTNSRMLSTENAFSPGDGSVAENTYDSYVAQQSGKTKLKDILYVAPMAPADVDVSDPDDLKRGLSVAYTDAPWVNLDRLVAEFYDISVPEADSRKFYLNQLVSSDSTWVGRNDWDALEDKTKALQPGDDIVMFFDGSRIESNDPTRDSTALVACRMSDGYVQLLGVAEYGDGKTTADVHLWVRNAFTAYNVVAFFADVREFESQVLTTWPEEHGDKVIVWANPSGKVPTVFGWDMRGVGNAATFTKAAETAYSDIMLKEFRHHGDIALSQHVYACARKPNNTGVSVGKESPNSPRKIDSAVCMIGARHARRIVMADKNYVRYLKRRNRGPAKAIVYTG